MGEQGDEQLKSEDANAGARVSGMTHAGAQNIEGTSPCWRGRWCLAVSRAGRRAACVPACVAYPLSMAAAATVSLRRFACSGRGAASPPNRPAANPTITASSDFAFEQTASTYLRALSRRVSVRSVWGGRPGCLSRLSISVAVWGNTSMLSAPASLPHSPVLDHLTGRRYILCMYRYV